jgi:hypothetical protein
LFKKIVEIATSFSVRIWQLHVIVGSKNRALSSEGSFTRMGHANHEEPVAKWWMRDKKYKTLNVVTVAIL